VELRDQGYTYDNVRDFLGVKIICRSKAEAKLIASILGEGQILAPYDKKGIRDVLDKQGEDGWRGIKLVGETITFNPQEPIEIQIMTRQMNQANNHGKAAHWGYKFSEEIKASLISSYKKYSSIERNTFMIGSSGETNVKFFFKYFAHIL